MPHTNTDADGPDPETETETETKTKTEAEAATDLETDTEPIDTPESSQGTKRIAIPDSGTERKLGRGPPNGHEFGERTKQSVDFRAPKYWLSDAEEIRQCRWLWGDQENPGGLTEFDVDEYLGSSKYARMCYPDAIIHERDPELTSSSKGTDVLFKGDRDSGKTTYARQLSVRLMERGERVIWRGRYDGSGWLPFREWTTLYLPANAECDPQWMYEGSDRPADTDADLERLVRDVYYYDDVFDLLEELGERDGGTFNVVYPDPSFSGCAEATEALENVAGRLPFVPEWEADAPEDATPLIQWWFGFWFARKEHGPFVWMSLIFDEVGDWLEEGARQDASRLYDKIKSLRKVWAASRKRLMSMYFFAHKEANVHWMVREEFKWRVHMPDNSPNPNQNQRSTIPQGFDTVQMYGDIMSDKDVGVGLIYTQNEFVFSGDPEIGDRWLKIDLNPPAAVVDAGEAATELDLEEPEYDDELFTYWQNGVQERLVVNDPGSGYVDCQAGTLSEGIESPVAELVFAEIETTGGVGRVLMAPAESPAGDGAAIADGGDSTASTFGEEPICVAKFRIASAESAGDGGAR